jgi:AbiV family abortive infection protein
LNNQREPEQNEKGQTISRQKYQELSEASFENAKELMEESELLLNNDRYARSYALAVLSLEEFAKSLMWKLYNLKCQRYKHEDLEFPKMLTKQITQHGTKQAIFLFNLVLGQMMEGALDQKLNGQPIKEAIDRKTSELDALLSKIANLEIDKQHAFYVDFREGRIGIPKDSVNKEKCVVLLKVLRESVDPFEMFVRLDMSSEMGQFMLKAWEEMDNPSTTPNETR